jgi:nitrite reductase/ring-hydroxylating ferredoxin subunit
MSALRPRVFRFQVVAIVVMGLALGTILLAGLGSTESVWVTISADKQMDDRVTFDEDDGVYLVRRGDRIIAFSNRGPWNKELVEYCPSSQLFETARSGSKFDIWGHYFYGPAPRGLTRYPVRVRSGEIQVNKTEPIPGPGRGASKKRVRQPVGKYCVW